MTVEEFQNLPYWIQAGQLRQALDELVKLSSHYAFLLNAYDGGKRRQFANADEWVLRLYEIGTLQSKVVS